MNGLQPCQNEQVVSLIRRAFDENGMLVRKGLRKNQKEARQILENRVGDIEGYVDGYEAHVSILIIAYPNKAI